jgi:bifunctional NMN adenylyltransferase/nudix hydrolase
MDLMLTIVGATMNTKTTDHDAMVLIGRFQPVHVGHMEVILQGLRQSKKLIVAIGSARSPRCYRNPFTYDEREFMIRQSVKEIDLSLEARLRVVPLVDLLYNDEQWIKNAQQAVYDHLERDETVSLIGHAKDRSSFYLNMFPAWKSTVVENYKNISATPMRNAYFSNIGEMWLKDCDGHKEGDTPRDRLVPPAVKHFLDDFIKTADYKYVSEEYEYITNYRKPYLDLPFPPIFTTVDACVIQSGHVLLVKRKTQPGKGLWALPGGFIRQDESLADATIRELYEETSLKLHERIIRGSAKQTVVFDDPYRSSRGRTITHATLFQLERRRELPYVKGADDAEKTWWCPLSEVHPEICFEDHFSVLQKLVGDK